MTLETKIDGRKARRARGREAVLSAVLRLLDQTRLPTAEELAREAGVSTASLFRYFDGLDDIYRQAADRFYDQHADLLESAPEAGHPLHRRTADYVELRLSALALLGPVLPLAKTQTKERPDLQPLFDRVRRQVSQQVERYFAPELRSLTPARRADLVSTLDAATSVDAGDMITEVYGRSPAQIRRAWTELLLSVLPPVPRRP